MNKKQEAFLKLPLEKQRVAIAEDVLKQLAAKKLNPKLGNAYLQLRKLYEGPKEAQVCDVLADQRCTVCALGGMMVAAVQKADQLTVADLGEELLSLSWHTCVKYLARFFDREQLNMIETAYEKLDHWPDSGGGPLVFEPKVRGAAKRMTLVMENIIKNKGTFVWPEVVA